MEEELKHSTKMERGRGYYILIYIYMIYYDFIIIYRYSIYYIVLKSIISFYHIIQ